MARFGTKKQLENFSDDLKKLSNDITNITNNVNGINQNVENYNEQISTIKNNVKSLENELKDFMTDVKITPIIENAKNQIKKDKEELNKFEKYELIRKRLFDMLNDINNKELLLTNEEKVKFNIPNFYLSYVLLTANNLISGIKKNTNNYIKQAINLNNEKTNLLLMLINIKLNNENDSLKYLNDYLESINPISTNSIIIKLIEYFKNNKKYLNKILNKLNEWQSSINDDKETYNTILDNYYKTFNNIKNNDEYPYIYEYTKSYEKLINNLDNSRLYTSIYNKINNYIENTNDIEYDLLNDIIYSYDGKELELRDNILKNEYIIKNKGKSKEIKHINNMNIFNIFLICLNKKYSKKTKYILLKYSKKYIKDILEEFTIENNNEEIEITIDKWNNKTIDGSNELELINNITKYIKKPFNDEIKNITIINFKTIYSFIFIIIGIIVLFFSTSFGIPMIIVGIVMLIYFTFDVNSYKKSIENEYNETINKYKDELYNLLSEIVDIKLEINKNIDNKNKLQSLFNKLEGVKYE